MSPVVNYFLLKIKIPGIGPGILGCLNLFDEHDRFGLNRISGFQLVEVKTGSNLTAACAYAVPAKLA